MSHQPAQISGLHRGILRMWDFHAFPNVGKVIVAVFLFLCLSPVYSQGLKYSVIIDAPNAIQRLLEENLGLVRWQGNERVDRTLLRRLYRQTPDEIKRLLETEGYYAPKIDSSMEPSGDAYQIHIRVDPGEPVLVNQVMITFTGAITLQETSQQPRISDLQNKWALREGSRFRQADWEAAKRMLLRQVMQVRYPRARIADSQAIVDPAARTAILRVEIDSGSPVYFGEINIVGLKRYSEDIILRERPVKPDTIYRESALLNWQTRIQDTGYFRSVEVTADVDSGLDSVPVTVTVVENKKRHAAIGVGYSTDMGNRFSLIYDDLKFLGQELNLKSGLVLETRMQTAFAEVALPKTDSGFRNSIGGRFERSDIRGEDIRLASLYGKTSWGTPRLEHYATLEYLQESTRVKGVGDENTKALPLTYGIIKRRLNSQFNPTRGYAVQAQVGAAVEPVLTDKSYLRPYLKAGYFHPVGEKGNLLLRTELGAVLSSTREGIPSTVLFRTGGDQSVRGYAFESLGVKKGRATIGGRYLAVGSMEYQYYFYGNWGGAVFVDAGNAGDNFKELNPAFGYGIGVRWRSPAGPFGIDFAYGEKTNEFRVHFSFGFTF
ncbi:MAG: autotransporter assembly complex protein TamA [Betaproteobacteria bacterium]|nr:autotransporter assembly complex protein TamA [Betaproteobacteria bacterium]